MTERHSAEPATEVSKPQAATERSAARTVPQIALALQRQVGNRATSQVLARVTYPHLRAVDPTHYSNETVSGAGFAPALTPKLDSLKALYTAVSGRPGTQRLTLTGTGTNSAGGGLTQIAGLQGLGGPWDPATKTASATVTEWHRLLNRWRDVLNEEYFSLPRGASPVGFPGRLPHNFNYSAAQLAWINNQMAAQPVRRDTDPERAASEIGVRNGRLVRANQRNVTTGDSVTWFKGLGWEIFVLSHDGHLHMASHLVGRRHHSSLLGRIDASATKARDAASAGEMQVRDGKIVQLSTKTGHYQSGAAQLSQIVHWLTKKGADLAGTVLLDFAGNVVSNDAQNWWTTTGRQAYERDKTDYTVRWVRSTYGAGADAPQLIALGWTQVNIVGTSYQWQMPNGQIATARDVRRALKSRFPAHFQPESSYGTYNVPTAVNV